jgi:hypothetical protein
LPSVPRRRSFMSSYYARLVGAISSLLSIAALGGIIKGW